MEEDNKLDGESIEEPKYLPPQRNFLAFISIICGLIGLFIIPIILGPVAIISGFMAYSQIKRSNQRGKEVAIMCIFLGILDIISLLIFIYTAS